MLVLQKALGVHPDDCCSLNPVDEDSVPEEKLVQVAAPHS